MTVVVPIWIVFNYLGKRHNTSSLNDSDHAAIESLTRVAERMEGRIATLEKILDAEVPQWRQTYRDTVR